MILCLCEFIGRLLNLRIFSKEQMQKAITRALCVCLSVGESTPVLRSVIYSNHLPSFLLWCSALSNAPPWIFIFSLQFIIWRNGEVPEVNVFRSTRVTLLFARWSTCVAKGEIKCFKIFPAWQIGWCWPNMFLYELQFWASQNVLGPLALLFINFHFKIKQITTTSTYNLHKTYYSTAPGKNPGSV